VLNLYSLTQFWVFLQAGRVANAAHSLQTRKLGPRRAQDEATREPEMALAPSGLVRVARRARQRGGRQRVAERAQLLPKHARQTHVDHDEREPEHEQHQPPDRRHEERDESERRRNQRETGGDTRSRQVRHAELLEPLIDVLLVWLVPL